MTEEKKELIPLSDSQIKLKLDPSKMVVIKDYFRKMRYHPVVSAALKCKGQFCDYASKCPLNKINELPEPGSSCPVEEALIDIWVEDRIRDLEIDPGDIIDQASVRSLVMFMLFDKRAFERLDEESLVLDRFRSMAIDGTPITDKELNPMLLLLEKSHKMQDRIMETLLATREAKSKDKSRQQKDQMKKVQDVLAKIDALAEVEKKTIPAEVTVKGKE